MPTTRAFASLARLIVLAVLGALLVMVQSAPAYAAPVGVPVPVGQAGTVLTWGSEAPEIPADLHDRGVTAIAAGDGFSLVLTDAGTLQAFAADHPWRTPELDVPDIPEGEDVTAIATGSNDHYVALTDAGTLLMNAMKPATIFVDQDGWPINRVIEQPSFPVDEKIVAIAEGTYDSSALTEAGTLFAWGSNMDGLTSPPAVPDGELATAISVGLRHHLALTDHGTVLAWGSNDDGQLDVPPTPDGEKITAIAAGGRHSLALTDHGTVLAWGSNDDGQLDVPPTPDGEKITAIAAGGRHSLALTDHGTILAWGDEDQTALPTISPGTRITAIAAGAKHSLAIATPVENVITNLTPMVSGDAAYGTTLTADVPGAPQGATVHYEWYADGQPILGATSTTLTLDDLALLGATVSVTATTRQPGHTPVERRSSGVQIARGTQTGALEITGDPDVGSTLNATSSGLVDNASVASYQWYDDGQPITGATGKSLELTPALLGKAITVSATATATGYHDLILTSVPVTVAKATFTQLDVTIDGNAKVGNTVTAQVEQAPIGTLAYEWTADGDPITDATGPSLALTPDLAGTEVAVTVTATRNGYTDRTETSAVVTVAKGTQTGTPPTITGNPIVDGILTAVPGDVIDDTTISYQWYADGDPISNATNDALTLTPDLVGLVISVTTTATLAGYDDLVLTSDNATAPVTEAVFTQLDVTIDGKAKVGHTVTAEVEVDPNADLSYVWSAGDKTVGTDKTLALTPDLADAELTVTVTANRNGYTDRTETSAVVTVAKGTQTGTPPTITGIPIVDGILTAVPGDVMDDAAISYQWYADGDPIDGATDTTLTLTPDLVGFVITVTTTTKLTGYDNVTLTVDNATTPVTHAVFTDTVVTIDGTAKAGETLTAATTATPGPDTVTYEWRRGNTVVGTDSNYTLTDDDEDQTLTVTATLSKAGYTDATATTTTPVVATRKAPSITLDSERDNLRLGQQIKVTWTSDRATEVTGNWTRTALSPNGTATVKPTATGRQAYTVTATNDNGTTTATTTIAVALPKTTLKVTTNKKKVRGTNNYMVRIKGLAPREKFTVRQGKNRATGTAGPQGNAKIRMTAPKRNKAKRVRIKVIGSLKDRIGQTRIRVRPHRIKATTAYRQVRASDPQVVTITGLAKREKVTLRYRGRVIHVGRATHRGVLTHRFKVGTAWGTDTIRARAHRTNRTAKTTFNVGRRCADGVWRCP